MAQTQHTESERETEQMPFKTSSFVALEDGNYILRLNRLEDAEGNYGPQVKWVFNVWTPDGVQMRDDRSGEDYEFFQYTGESTGPKSKARPWIEALLGRAMPDRPTQDEVRAITEEIIGKYMDAFIAVDDAGYSKIVHAKKRVPKGQAAAAPPPAEEPALPF